MLVNEPKENVKRIVTMMLVFVIIIVLVSGCGNKSGSKVKLDPKNPVTVTVWHYYNGSVMNAFEQLIQDFNETVGIKEGIIVESFGLGSIPELEKAVLASANEDIGSMDMPNIYASYADTAYDAEKMGLLANLGDYFTQEEQKEYIDSFISEGEIGTNGELRIFPIAKSTEVLMINDTDWQTFADANGLSYNNLTTLEDITRIAEIYYNWTDSLTPDIQNDGKAFFGRDSMANLFIISSKGFGTEIFKVEDGTAVIDADEHLMRKIWENYYIPYIKGYFYSFGRYRSDDAKVGDIIAYVGSTSSASYFPNEVTNGNEVYPVDAKVFPAPQFANAEKFMVQQGAGMVVVKSTQQAEYASVEFLKWFTSVQENIEFASLSGYLPVKKAAFDYNVLLSAIDERGLSLDEMTKVTLKASFEEASISEMYTNKVFNGGAAARAILEYSLQDKAVADRKTVLEQINNGSTQEEAVANFLSEENFYGWLQNITSELDKISK